MFGTHEALEHVGDVQGSLGRFGVDGHEEAYHVPWDEDGWRHVAGN
jgi:hypothetical protein